MVIFFLMNNIFIFFSLILIAFDIFSAEKQVIIQSTTSTRDSGFYEYILPKYNEVNSTKIRVVSVGTGQAIRNAQRCDGDILFVHHRKSEENFVKNGYGLYRKEVMYNDYVLIGPKSDPAKILGLKSIKEALQKIQNSQSLFVSRGDDSGTHKKETFLWKEFLNEVISTKKYPWYIETGSGMGATLNISVNLSAYTLTDRSSWIFFGNKKEHMILVENELVLLNPYGIIPINPKRCKNANIDEAENFINWLISPSAQRLILDYKKDGKQLFFPINKY